MFVKATERRKVQNRDGIRHSEAQGLLSRASAPATNTRAGRTTTSRPVLPFAGRWYTVKMYVLMHARMPRTHKAAVVVCGVGVEKGGVGRGNRYQGIQGGKGRGKDRENAAVG